MRTPHVERCARRKGPPLIMSGSEACRVHVATSRRFDLEQSLKKTTVVTAPHLAMMVFSWGVGVARVLLHGHVGAARRANNSYRSSVPWGPKHPPKASTPCNY